MRQVKFTQEFYKAVYNELQDFAKDYDFGCDFDVEPTIEVEFNGRKYSLDVEVGYGKEWHDDSFDHAFGTWHDPNPYWDYNGCIEGLGKVRVYDVTDADNEEVVEGFDESEFWHQFDEDHYYDIKAGDKVIYSGKEYEFVSYNAEQCRCTLKDADGQNVETVTSFSLKKVA